MISSSNPMIKKIQTAIAATVPEGALESLLFKKGNHWQKSRGWIGPRPAFGDLNARLVIKEIERLFISANVIGEIVNRHSRAVVGREPAWAVLAAEEATPIPDALIAEINDSLLGWWDSEDKQVMAVLQDAVDLALIAEHAILRLYLPPALTADGNEIPPFPTLKKAMDKIWIEVLPMGSAAHIRDRKTMEVESDYLYLTEDKIATLERETLIDGAIAPIDEETGQPILEEAQASGRLLTFIEILQARAGGDLTVIESVTVDTGGRLLTFDLRLPILITDQIRQMQKGLNVDLTMMIHNILGTGFLERTIFNAQMPGEWIKDDTIDGGRRFVPRPYNVGMGVTNNLVGLPQKDDEGNTTGYATPSIVYREPTGVGMFTDAQKALYAAMLHEAQQSHALISGESTPSGESRKQALADFLVSISLTITRCQSMIRWLLETTAALALYMCDRAVEFDAIRASVLMKLTLPPLSADELRVLNELVKDGFISHEIALSMVPFIDDPDAEKQRITLEQADKQAAQVTTLASALRQNQQQFDQGGQAA